MDSRGTRGCMAEAGVAQPAGALVCLSPLCCAVLQPFAAYAESRRLLSHTRKLRLSGAAGRASFAIGWHAAPEDASSTRRKQPAVRAHGLCRDAANGAPRAESTAGGCSCTIHAAAKAGAGRQANAAGAAAAAAGAEARAAGAGRQKPSCAIQMGLGPHSTQRGTRAEVRRTWSTTCSSLAAGATSASS